MNLVQRIKENKDAYKRLRDKNMLSGEEEDLLKDLGVLKEEGGVGGSRGGGIGKGGRK